MSHRLLDTKFHIPLWRSGGVIRPRLSERLNLGLVGQRKLTLVSAPAGYGKTTLVAGWLARMPVGDSPHSDSPPFRVAWLSLDEADNDPARFLSYWLSAWQRADPALAHTLQNPLGVPPSAPLTSVLDHLLNELVAVDAPVVLVLDDYHAITNPELHDALGYFVEHQPASVNLIIITRQDPPLPLSRMRARGQLTEIRGLDLRFTAAECADFFAQTMGLHLQPAWIAALERRTEGWIAGLQLAALSLQGRDDVEAFIQAFSGDHRYVIDYLVDEVLDHQPPGVRDFLVQTSILDRLCGPLCNAVVQIGESANRQIGKSQNQQITKSEDRSPAQGFPDVGILRFSDSQDILDYLEQCNLFLIPLDDHRQWYRYHHLFADSLQASLDVQQQRALHRRAAGWFAANELLFQAVPHAFAAADLDLAADLLATAGYEGSLWAGGEFKQYLAWVESLPPDIVRTRPRLRLCYGRALYLYGRLPESIAAIEAVDRDLRSEPAPDEALIAIAAAYRVHYYLERGELDKAQALVRYAVDHLPQDVPADRTRALYALAVTHYAQGQMGAAEPLFERAEAIARREGALSLAFSAGEYMARCLVVQGRLDAARAQCEKVIAAGKAGKAMHPVIVGALLSLSEIAYLQDDLDQIEPIIDQAMELAQQMGTLLRSHQCWAYQQLARLRSTCGDVDGAVQAAANAAAVARDIDNTFYRRATALATEFRDQTHAHNTVMSPHAPVFAPLSYYALAEFEAFAQSYRRMADRRLDGALPILERLLAQAQQDGRVLDVIVYTVWRALAHQMAGQPDAAMAALAHALSLAEPQCCLRPFLDPGPAIAPLLQQAVARGPAARFAVQLLDRLPAGKGEDGDPRASAPGDTAVLPEPLTEREVEILQLLAGGMSNKEISRELYLTVGTVKWYLTNLYGKLGVGNRTQAVARARESGILQ